MTCLFTLAQSLSLALISFVIFDPRTCEAHLLEAALRTLRPFGLPSVALRAVLQATVVKQIIAMSPRRGGVASTADCATSGLIVALWPASR